MKIIENSIVIEHEEFSDPGDYPCNAGSSPLPSYWYFSHSGQLVLEAETEQEMEDFEYGSDWLDNYVDFPDISIRWTYHITERRLVATIKDCESTTEDYGDY